MTLMNTTILYHADCMDGFGAAFAAWLKLGATATYIPVQYGQPMPEIVAGSTVRILDFSYPRAELLALVDRCPDTRVIDHHKVAAEDLAGLDFAIFDKKKSGAVLAWEFFHPNEDVPELLLYVQDRDLWAWSLPESRRVNLGLRGIPTTFEMWDDVNTLWQAWKGLLVSGGRFILTSDNSTIARLTASPAWMRILCYTVPAVNTPVLQSEVGEALLAQYPHAPFAVMWSALPDGSRRYSLRSRKGEFDVSVIAKEYGGGGHQPAAGFNHPVDFPVVKKEGGPQA